MLFLLVSLTASPVPAWSHECGGYGEEGPGVSGSAGYTRTDLELWPASVIIPYAFVSNGDCLQSEAFYTDPNIGHSKEDMAVIMKAMRKIEDETCIRFKRVKPQPGQNWLMLMREGDGHHCYRSYIKEILSNKNINGLGKLFSYHWDYSTSCFSGYYTTWLGLGSPNYLVTSMVDIQDTEGIVGDYVHELFHILGVGHTQKRPDRDGFITVNKQNINRGAWSQYDKCSKYCETHGTSYDCASIMHYRDWAFQTWPGKKTMTPKDPFSCDLSRPVTRMSNSDIKLLNKMYCNGLPASKVGNLNKELKTNPDDTICNKGGEEVEDEEEEGKKKGPGFIITGGLNLNTLKKVEAFNPGTGRSCSLPDLAQEMEHHSHCDRLICRDRSCIKIHSSGSSSPASVSLRERRSKHMCWSLPGGEVMLIGGEYSQYTSEVVSADGSSTKSNWWSLAHKTYSACGVGVGEHFIITGGEDRYRRDWALNNVVRYGRHGDFKELPRLNVRRSYHACATYLTDNGQNVLLVSGGWNNRAKYLDSTEIMVDFTYWKPAAYLPSPRSGLQAASLDNKVFVFGGYKASNSILSLEASKSILSYDPDSDRWETAGSMTLPRYDHAVAVYTDLTHLCP